MPNKTLYVKDADVELFERAQEQLGESVSGMFAEFLRERVANLTPEEGRIVGLLNEIAQVRDAAKKDGKLPRFVEGAFTEAEDYANRSLKSLQRGDIKKAKVLYYAANVYRDKAERDVKDAKELNGKIAAMLNEN